MRRLLATALLLTASSVSADTGLPPSAKDYLQAIEASGPEKDAIALSLHSMALAFTMANVDFRHGGGQPLFCVPEALALTAEQDASILERYVKKNPDVADEPAVAVFLFALKDTFPCPSK